MGIRVLLVEDEHAIGDFVARGLREEGFAVVGRRRRRRLAPPHDRELGRLLPDW